jgi:AhpD family alkylhydroperoxidase
MQSRIEYMEIAPGAMKTLFGLEKYLAECGLEPLLIDLIKLRASQINGCAYCIDIHTKDARTRGESDQRLYELVAWRETPFYTERERAALAWTEAVTLIAGSHVPDEVYEQDLVNLTLALVAINGWNHFAISFRTVPGTYQPASH